jgi:hypothetical protein
MTILQILLAWSAVALATCPLVGEMLRRRGATIPRPHQPASAGPAPAAPPRDVRYEKPQDRHDMTAAFASSAASDRVSANVLG